MTTHSQRNTDRSSREHGAAASSTRRELRSQGNRNSTSNGRIPGALNSAWLNGQSFRAARQMSSKVGLWMGLALLGLGLAMVLCGAVGARPTVGARKAQGPAASDLRTTFLSHRPEQDTSHSSQSSTQKSHSSTARTTTTTTATTTIVTTTTTTGQREHELLNVCCHHTIAFEVVPNITWGATTLEQQSTWTSLGCDGVLKRRFGSRWTADAPRLCRAMDTPVYTFYMYRVTGEKDWPIENVNTASLGGVLWYLHNEVIVERPRKFGITRIRRFQVQVAGTQELAQLNMTFGVRFAYDTQKCTGAGPWASEKECDKQYEKYGYFVGCNSLGSYPFPTAAKGYPNHYPEAVWYSLPEGGRCHGRPTGEKNCTYSFTEMGDMAIDELVGIKDYDSLPGGWKEYDVNMDRGSGFSWWDHKYDDWACRQRWERAREIWARKYPDFPADEDLPAPSCDFKCSFYEHPPLECTRPQPTGAGVCNSPDSCWHVASNYHAPAVGHYTE